MSNDVELDHHQNNKNVPNYSNLFVFSGANKAGMDMIDKERQSQIIYEMSKNSAYFKRTVKLDESANQKALIYRKQFEAITGKLAQSLQSATSSKLVEYEKKRNLNRICCVLDMDMFFAAVEIRDRPELKDLPVAVGGDMMISTSNYIARKYGVRAAMPGFIAKKLCPNLVFVSSNFSKYEEVSSQMKSIIAEYDPDYHSHSLDEVYFDLTIAAQRKANGITQDKHNLNFEFGNDIDHQIVHHSSVGFPIEMLREIALELLQEIRQKIKEVTNGLTCSAGMANNFFLAKICADINKPDGQFQLPPNRQGIIDFLTNLPVRKVGGIGKVTENILSRLEMTTLGQVRENLFKIVHTFTPALSGFLMRVSIGIGEEEGEKSIDKDSGTISRKSIGCERTFDAKGIEKLEDLLEKLTYISQRVSKDMLSEHLIGKCLTLKVKDTNFNLSTKAISLPNPTNKEDRIFNSAKTLLLHLYPVKVRLLGVSMSKLSWENNYIPPGSTASCLKAQQSFRNFFAVPKLEHSDSHMTKEDSTNDLVEATSFSQSYEVMDLIEEELSPTEFLTISKEPEISNDCLAGSQLKGENQLYSECLDDINDIEIIEVHPKTQQPITDDPISCPICNYQLPNNIMQMNLHIDKCLLGPEQNIEITRKKSIKRKLETSPPITQYFCRKK